MPRKSGFIRRNNRMVRETVWIGSNFLSNTLSTGSATLLQSLNAAALLLRPFTVVRTRGRLNYFSDQSATSESSLGAYGHAVVSDQATAIGVTAIPTPVTDDGSDLWYVFESLMFDFNFGDATGFQQAPPPMTFDSKAMRKVDIGQDVVIVAEQSSAVGAILQSHFRLLAKLH